VKQFSSAIFNHGYRNDNMPRRTRMAEELRYREKTTRNCHRISFSVLELCSVTGKLMSKPTAV